MFFPATQILVPFPTLDGRTADKERSLAEGSQVMNNSGQEDLGFYSADSSYLLVSLTHYSKIQDLMSNYDATICT